MRYNILCRQVLPDGRGLEECGPSVRFLPRRVGLSNTSVMVADLQSHTNYSFLLEAVNGVSELAKDHAKQYVTLNVTTNQAGMLSQICHSHKCNVLPITASPLVFQPVPQLPHFISSTFQSYTKCLYENHHCFVMILLSSLLAIYTTCALHFRRQYLGLITKAPDDQIITVFVQQICRCINLHLRTTPTVNKGTIAQWKAFCVFTFASRFVIEKAAWSHLGRTFNQDEWHNESD